MGRLPHRCWLSAPVWLAVVALLILDPVPGGAAGVNDPETITKEQAREQADRAQAILRGMGFQVSPPDWMANYGVTVGDVWHNQPEWWLMNDDTLNTPEGKIGWSVVVIVFLSPEAARINFDEYLKRENEKTPVFQQFMATTDGAGYVGMTQKAEARLRCGNVQIKLGWRRGLPLGVAEDDAYVREGLAAVRAMAPRVHDALAQGGVCGAAAAEPKRNLDPPIPSAAIDQYLDLLAAKLTAARDLASAPSLDPLAPPTGPFSYQQSATMATTVWLECQGLVKAHIDRRLLLNDVQKRRLKAFCWWVDWLVRRGANPYKIQWSTPPYPLFGAIDQPVPTPPQYKGEEFSTVLLPYFGTNEAITDDYAWFVVSTTLRIGDLYTTGGLLYTAYLACTSDSLSEVALTGLTSIPYVGKWISALLCTYVEGNAVYRMGADGVNPLTWDQHVANICALTNLGLQGIRTYSPDATRARVPAGVDEGNIPPEVAQKFGGKSFQVGARQTKQLAGGQTVEVAQADYAVVGPYKTKQGKGLVAYEQRQVAIIKRADGTERYYALEGDKLGEPIFFLGEKGYHVWSHLTERKSGHETGFRSVKDVVDDRPDYLKPLAEVEKTMRDPAGDLAHAEKMYIEFVNNLIGDGKYEKMQGWYVYTKRGATADAPRIPVGGKEANTFVMVPRPRSDPSQVTCYSVRVSIDPATGKLMNVFVNTPGGKSPWMSDMLADSLRKHFFSWNDQDKVVFTCPSLKAIMGEQQ
jgi:hypothetical protein